MVQDSKRKFVDAELEKLHKSLRAQDVPNILVASHDGDDEHCTLAVAVPDLPMFCTLWGSVIEKMLSEVDAEDRQLFVRWLRQVIKHITVMDTEED